MTDITTLITELRELRDNLSAHEVAALDRAADALEAQAKRIAHLLTVPSNTEREHLKARAVEAEAELAIERGTTHGRISEQRERAEKAEQERDAAHAVIEAVLEWFTDPIPSDDLRHILAVAPVDVLAARDRRVAADAWDEGWDAREDAPENCGITGGIGSCGECAECTPLNPYRIENGETAE